MIYFADVRDQSLSIVGGFMFQRIFKAGTSLVVLVMSGCTVDDQHA